MEEYKYQETYDEDELSSFLKKQLANILTARNIDVSFIAIRKNALHACLDEALLDEEDESLSKVNNIGLSQSPGCVTHSSKRKKNIKGKRKDDLDFIKKMKKTSIINKLINYMKNYLQ